MYLFRAIACPDDSLEKRLEFANKPPQLDPDEEDLRITAQESLRDLESLSLIQETWYPVANRILGRKYKPTQRDDWLRTSINTTLLSPIVGHGAGSWYRLRGMTYSISLDRTSDFGHFTPENKPAHNFVDVVRGLQGRTTSRLEDEAVCLYELLGLDVGRVYTIPVMPYQIKRFLSMINS